MKDYDINSLLEDVDFNQYIFKTVGNNIMLTNKEIDILNRYSINYQKCNSLKEILFYIEDIIDDMDIVDEDLEEISYTISERDYYQNTNK